jgi:exodeoxyribonuclease VII small subunit
MARTTEPDQKDADQPQSFEAALADLESIIQELEAGEKGLEDSLKLYERGVAALRVCHDFLNKAEQRIKKLVAGPDGRPVLDDMGPAAPEEDQGSEDQASGNAPGKPSRPRPGRSAKTDPGGAASPKSAPPPKTGDALFGGA